MKGPFTATSTVLSTLIILTTISHSALSLALPNSGSDSPGTGGVEGVEELFQEGIWDPDSYDPLELFIDMPAAAIKPGFAKPDILIPWIQVKPRIDYENRSWRRVLLGLAHFDRPRYVGRIHLREKKEEENVFEANKEDEADYEIMCNFFQDDGKDPGDADYRRIAVGEAFRPKEEMDVVDLADGVVCHAFIAGSFQ